MAVKGILTTFSVIAYWTVFLGIVGGRGGKMLLMSISIFPIKFLSEALFDVTSDFSISVFWLFYKLVVCLDVSVRRVYYFLVYYFLGFANLRFRRLPMILSSYLTLIETYLPIPFLTSTFYCD